MRNLFLRLTVLLGVLFVFGLVPNFVSADDLARKEIYQHTLKGTAWVIAGDGAGTAWVVDASKKLLITNHHVTGTNETVRVIFPTFDKNRVVAERAHYLKNANTLAIRGKVLRTDLKRDLSLIEVETLPEGVIELKIAEDGAGPSDNVHSVGNPGISEALWVYTSGTVRQVYRRKVKIDGNEIDARVVETQAPLNPGDSGGPVVNDKGELIGVTAAINRSAQLLSICIDASEVKDFLTAAKVSVVAATAAPKTADEFLTRARTFFKKGQFDQAIADCTVAIKLSPESFLGYRQRGVILTQKGDYKKAVEDLSAAIDKNPKDPYAWFYRSKSFEKLGEKEKAKTDFDQAAKLDPNVVK